MNSMNNEMIIEYKIIDNEKIIKIFGTKFVQHNKDKCKLISKNKEFNLLEKINVEYCDIYKSQTEAFR